MLDKKVSFIGGGHITDILLENLLQNNLISPNNVFVSDPQKDKLEKLQKKYSINKAINNLESVNVGEFIFINVLPQVVEAVIQELHQFTFSSSKVIISIAAGIPMKKYSILREKIPIVRALPNPPSQVGQGITALSFNDFVSESQRKDVLALFKSLGEIVILLEGNINAATALSSPASFFLFFQSMIDAGVRAGIDRASSTKIVSQTLIGAMEVWRERQITPNELMNEACTPGGLSSESIFTLDKYVFRAAINDAIQKATEKANSFSNSL